MVTSLTGATGDAARLTLAAFFHGAESGFCRRALGWLGLAWIGLGALDATAQEAVVRAVIDGDTITLAQPINGATEVRLVGIQAPKIPLGRMNFPTWPLGPEATTGLESLVAGKTVRLIFTGEPKDRHRRLLAHVHVGDTWIQGEMLRLGLARVYTFPDNRARAAEMLALEREARAKGRGIWSHPFYRVRSADGLGRDIETFQLVAGVVFKATETRHQLYLNFAEDWRRDFTIVVPRQALKSFRDAGVDLPAVEGRTVRVRGWIKSLNGPSVDLTHPEQIEVDFD